MFLRVLSAAHCLGPKEKISVDDCGSSLDMEVKLRCKELKNGDLKISPVGKKNRPEVLVGVSNIHRDYEYDVILIKLKRAVDGVTPVCLPNNIDYPDTGNATIAGYGRFKRPPCEVGPQGPHKFEFCGVDKDCVKGSQMTGCQHEPTPSASNPLCADLRRKTKLEFSATLDEAVIVRKRRKKKSKLEVVTRCFREEPGSYGWCGTIHDYSGLDRQRLRVTASDGWGFCQKSCFPSPEEELGGVERFKHVEVINTNYCRRRLLEDGEFSFKVEPKVLCVAFNHTFHTQWYLLEDESDSLEFSSEASSVSTHRYTRIRETAGLREQVLHRKNDWYIIGTGSCAGDSGGPLFKQVPIGDGGGGGGSPLDDDGKKEYVLIGVTSRGTGIRGNCGGLDNPTHYVRIKLFLSWIKRYIKPDDLCLSRRASPEAEDKHARMNPDDEPEEVDAGEKHSNEDEDEDENDIEEGNRRSKKGRRRKRRKKRRREKEDEILYESSSLEKDEKRRRSHDSKEDSD